MIICCAIRLERNSDYASLLDIDGPRATVLQTGFLDQATINRLKASGAVGDISSRSFDLQGKPALGDVNDLLVGLSWEDLRQLQTVVAVAGPNRSEAVVGALRTGLLHVLIIDEQTAQKVLD